MPRKNKKMTEQIKHIYMIICLFFVSLSLINILFKLLFQLDDELNELVIVYRTWTDNWSVFYYLNTQILFRRQTHAKCD